MNFRNESVGKVNDYSVNDGVITGSTANHRFKLTPYNQHIIRVQISRYNSFDEYPYAVIIEPEQGVASVDEQGESILLDTGAIKCHINTSALRLNFENAKGDLLNADDSSFGVSWLGERVTNYKQLAADEIFLGLGEKGGGVNRRGSSYDNWNTDSFGFDNDTDPLYVSTPFFIGIREGKPYGIFLDNTYKTHFNFGTSNNERFSYFSADGGDMNYYFIQGDKVADVIRQYAKLTGTIEMPPLWSLGFQQCRYSYYPDFEVETIAKTFRDKKIPADVIYLDIHYMEAYKAFTFDNETFPNPKALIEKLEGMGFKVVVILDPGIKTEDGYGTYERGVEEDIFVKYPDGAKYEASVWPGNSHFTDFTLKKGRDWWGKELKFYTDMGLEGFWNDMNEPACWGQDMPDMIEFDYEGQQVSHLKARNVYGYQMVRSTFEGARKIMGNKRPFTLTRSGYSGVQRYSAVWTGDNVAGDDFMLLGQRIVNSLGLTGIPFAGYDVGGFVEESSPALFSRWLALASFAPFFRVHSMVNSRDSEPWAYGEEVEEISRNYINLRYKLLPYIYSLFYEAHEIGLPINRSLAINYHQEEAIYGGNAQNEFTLGEWLLVCPTTSTQDFAKIYLPAGNWYNFFNDEHHHGSQHLIVETGMEDLPVFAKEGAIIPMQSEVQHTRELHDQTLRLHVYHGAVKTEQWLYEDDGETYDFQQGMHYERQVIFDGTTSKLTLKAKTGDFVSRFRNLKVYLHGFENDDYQINGIATSAKQEDLTLLDPITEFDPLPQRDKKHMVVKGIKCLEIAYTDSEITLSW
ncbi:MAG: glycoside hydrolase family 31 protein [Roseivirga sp.]|nr:glycoside hydrolase family 31 protein [Roseivirga sp.]